MFSALAAVCTVDCAIEIVLITLHYITLYKEKTELLWVGSWYNLSALEGCGPALRLDADTVEAKDHVRVLGVTFWVDLTLVKNLMTCNSAPESLTCKLAPVARNILAFTTAANLHVTYPCR